MALARGDDSAVPPVWVDGRGWMCWDGSVWLRWDGGGWSAAASTQPAANPWTGHSPQRVDGFDGSSYAHISGQSRASVTPAAINGYVRGSLLALAGGSLVTVGALLPFINQSIEGTDVGGGSGYIKPGALHTSCGFGVLLIVVAILSYYTHLRRSASVIGTVMGVLGLGGYVVLGIVGLVGVTDDDIFGARVTWLPNIGLIFSIVGCAMVAIGAFRTVRIPSFTSGLRLG